MLAQVSARLIRFVLVIFAARLLGASEYGKFAFAIAYNSLFLILMDWGLNQLLVREIARKPETAKKYLGNELSVGKIAVERNYDARCDLLSF